MDQGPCLGCQATQAECTELCGCCDRCDHSRRTVTWHSMGHANDWSDDGPDGEPEWLP